jgi:hypothetical protein
MDNFPEEINRETCMSILEKNQIMLIKETRAIFTDHIKKALERCDKSVTLTFDDKLWSAYRVDITGELLQRFGEFATSTAQSGFVVTKVTQSPNEISKNIKSIRIDF